MRMMKEKLQMNENTVDGDHGHEIYDGLSPKKREIILDTG